MKLEQMAQPKVTNEVITPLEGQELDQARYSELAKNLINNKYTKKAEVKFQWKPTMAEGYDEKEDLVIAETELMEDGSIAISTESWQASISPDGKITGEMPQKLIEFLTYNKKDYDIEFNGTKEHKTDYIKQGFGNGGQSIITSFKYEKNRKIYNQK